MSESVSKRSISSSNNKSASRPISRRRLPDGFGMVARGNFTNNR